MILGIMQPYFFPYLGHFQLILATQRWVVFDSVRYSPKSWMNRNRILHPAGGWQYVTVPVSGSRDQPLSLVRMVDAAAAERRILGQLDHYRGKAPHFADVRDLVHAAFARTRTCYLRDLNVQSLAVVCEFLGIPFDWCLASELGLDLSHVEHAGQWALEISAALGAAQYINPPGGRGIFRREEWKARGIDLRFLQPATLEYGTGPYSFQGNLSILDILMWNDRQRVMEFISNTIQIEA
jgi:hypothetical protein